MKGGGGVHADKLKTLMPKKISRIKKNSSWHNEKIILEEKMTSPCTPPPHPIALAPPSENAVYMPLVLFISITKWVNKYNWSLFLLLKETKRC